jgi:hypothetical protein
MKSPFAQAGGEAASGLCFYFFLALKEIAKCIFKK